MPRPRTLTWTQALTAYEQHLRAQHASPRTVEEHLRDLRHLAARLDHLRPADVTITDLREHQVGLFSGETSISRRPQAARTVSKATSILRRFFGFLHEEELLAANPSVRLEQPRCPKGKVGDVLTVRQVQRLLAAAKPGVLGLRDRAMAEVLYNTGLRRAEILALDLPDLCHDERIVTVRCGKGGRGAASPLAGPPTRPSPTTSNSPAPSWRPATATQPRRCSSASAVCE